VISTILKKEKKFQLILLSSVDKMSLALKENLPVRRMLLKRSQSQRVTSIKKDCMELFMLNLWYPLVSELL
jgi:hypothetical protein